MGLVAIIWRRVRVDLSAIFLSFFTQIWLLICAFSVILSMKQNIFRVYVQGA